MSYCLNPDCSAINEPQMRWCQYCGTKLLIGDRYRGLRTLSRGGFGPTILGCDEAKPSQPLCVLKQFLPVGSNDCAKAFSLFVQEAERLDSLGQHPQIPELLAYMEQDGYHYLVQEFILGDNLQEVMQREGLFSGAQVRQLLRDLLSVLDFIHERQVIHRDIKPENIIRRNLEKDSNLKQYVLVDFGAAKLAELTSGKQTSTRIGSPDYMAPEQSKGKTQFASDLYSLGTTCLHLLTGIPPLELQDLDGNWQWQQMLPHPIEPQLIEMLNQLVANAISQRYRSAKAAIAVLEKPTSTSSNTSSYLSPAQKFLLTRSPYKPANAPQKPTTLIPTAPAPQLTKARHHSCLITIKRNALGQVYLDKQITYHLHSEFTELISPDLGLRMMAIPSGHFMMGAVDSEYEHFADEKPLHQVKVNAFYMSAYPITQAQWKLIMANNPSRYSNPDHPVTGVSWQDAQDFCLALSRRTGRSYRLPSEAEWEYACRGGTSTAFGFGETLPPDLATFNGQVPYLAIAKTNSHRHTTIAGNYLPNRFGLWDMHGNVWEWCEDIWQPDYLLAPIDGTAQVKIGSEKSRVKRGGSWQDGAVYARSAARMEGSIDQKDGVTGLRVVVSA